MACIGSQKETKMASQVTLDMLRKHVQERKRARTGPAAGGYHPGMKVEPEMVFVTMHSAFPGLADKGSVDSPPHKQIARAASRIPALVYPPDTVVCGSIPGTYHKIPPVERTWTAAPKAIAFSVEPRGADQEHHLFRGDVDMRSNPRVFFDMKNAVVKLPDDLGKDETCPLGMYKMRLLGVSEDADYNAKENSEATTGHTLSICTSGSVIIDYPAELMTNWFNGCTLLVWPCGCGIDINGKCQPPLITVATREFANNELLNEAYPGFDSHGRTMSAVRSAAAGNTHAHPGSYVIPIAHRTSGLMDELNKLPTWVHDPDTYILKYGMEIESENEYLKWVLFVLSTLNHSSISASDLEVFTDKLKEMIDATEDTSVDDAAEDKMTNEDKMQCALHVYKNYARPRLGDYFFTGGNTAFTLNTYNDEAMDRFMELFNSVPSQSAFMHTLAKHLTYSGTTSQLATLVNDDNVLSRSVTPRLMYPPTNEFAKMLGNVLSLNIRMHNLIFAVMGALEESEDYTVLHELVKDAVFPETLVDSDPEFILYSIRKSDEVDQLYTYETIAFDTNVNKHATMTVDIQYQTISSQDAINFIIGRIVNMRTNPANTSNDRLGTIGFVEKMKEYALRLAQVYTTQSRDAIRAQFPAAKDPEAEVVDFVAKCAQLSDGMPMGVFMTVVRETFGEDAGDRAWYMDHPLTMINDYSQQVSISASITEPDDLTAYVLAAGGDLILARDIIMRSTPTGSNDSGTGDVYPPTPPLHEMDNIMVVEPQKLGRLNMRSGNSFGVTLAL